MINLRLILFCVCFLVAGGFAAVAGPTVGCAGGNVTHAICGDPKLSQLNREARSLYRKALLVADGRSRVMGQRYWVTERNRLCAGKAGTELSSCITQSLNARILELRNVVEQETLAPPSTLPTREKVVVASTPSSPSSQELKTNLNCASVVGSIDNAICRDNVLSHWEDRLGKFYQQALNDPSSRSFLVQDQQRWIGERSSNCGPLSAKAINDCVLQITKRRVEQLVQVIDFRDDAQDRASKIEKILLGKSVLPPGLDADSIDRESARADQSELVIEDARNCIRRNVGAVSGVTTSDPGQLAAQMSAACFNDFSKKLSALELGALAKPSFEMLVRQELSASK